MLRASKILFKSTGSNNSFALSSDKRSYKLKARPLFSSISEIDQTEDELRLSGGAPAQWYMAEFDGAFRDAWDVCHAMVSADQSVTGGRVLFAEPDFEQNLIWNEQSNTGFGMAGQSKPSKPQATEPYEYVADREFWHLDDDFTQLLKARGSVKRGHSGDWLRIAHFDTGYDPDHISLAKLADPELHRNFYDDDPELFKDARDRKNGLAPDNLGHGTGTLSTLAGQNCTVLGKRRPISGGADFEILPIRVAASVVLFRNSAIARAFDYVHSLADNPETRCDVVTMSMGGLACSAWADAINALYEKGIVVVTAAGNNYNNLPTRNIVYPARFHRVVAACGVMAGGSPYADLTWNKMQGNYGPKSRMGTAMSAYTPNVPWARFGSKTIFDFNGGGTSQATPQIASAAALWMQSHASTLPKASSKSAWKRAEMTRQALFRSANQDRPDTKRLGHGVLRARDALNLKPVDLAKGLKRAKRDSVSFPFLKLLFGRGFTDISIEKGKMLELEALQLSQIAADVERPLEDADPDNVSPADEKKIRRALAAMRDDARSSAALKAAISMSLGEAENTSPILPMSPQTIDPDMFMQAGDAPSPGLRRLRIFASDPLAATRDDQFHLNTAVLNVTWEDPLSPGPRGEYLEVVDIDPPSNLAYAPVDLNNPKIIAADGLSPSEGKPQFHQQMVYAVGMRTIALFETALGRRALWSERVSTGDNNQYGWRFVRRLRIYPHALREANAYYSPSKKALLFGYFRAKNDNVGDNLPGGLVFTCLSHDIIAHEISHALLDGLHPRFSEPSNGDMWAFHEAFSDIVALFQHFMIPESLTHEIERNRGDVGLSDALSGLAHQFGQAIQKRGALRSAIWSEKEDGKWERLSPSKTDYHKYPDDQPHMRGSILVAAIFDAFLKIYHRETRDLINLATDGAGVLPEGNLPPLLAEKLSNKAAIIAGRVLNIAIRALDYCPPVALTFGEYLRALITADKELVPNDDRGYRVAFTSAFRDRGIYPESVSNLSDESLCWFSPSREMTELKQLLEELDVDWDLKTDRFDAYVSSNENARKLAFALRRASRATLHELGLISDTNVTVIDGIEGRASRIEVHSVRPAVRVGPDLNILRETIIELTQSWTPKGDDGASYRGGCTIIFDPETSTVKYIIRKRLGHKGRLNTERALRANMRQSVHGSAYDDPHRGGEPFAFLHRH
jgi:subtilisin family serine protease